MSHLVQAPHNGWYQLSVAYPCPESVLSQVICFLNIIIAHYVNNLFICFLVNYISRVVTNVDSYISRYCVSLQFDISQVGQSPAEIKLHSNSPKSMNTVHNNNKFLALPNMDRKCLRDPCVTKWNLVIFNHKHHNLFPLV